MIGKKEVGVVLYCEEYLPLQDIKVYVMIIYLMIGRRRSKFCFEMFL
jgi:hypothetical protein